MVAPFPLERGAPHGGVEAATENLYSGLEVRNDLQVVGLDIRPEFTEVTVHEGRLGPILRVPAGRAMGRVRRSKRIVEHYAQTYDVDIVHCQGAARLLPDTRPSVLTVHGFLERDTTFDGGGRLRRRLKMRTVVKAEVKARFASKNVIAISDFSAGELIRVPDAGSRRVFKIPNAVHPSYFEPTDPQDRSGVLFAGRISRLKGVLELIKAFALVIEQMPDARLSIAGSGLESEYGASCQALVEELQLQAAVHFEGELGRSELKTAILASQCVAIPSYVEAAPMIVAESLVLGTPVAASAVGAVPEMLRAGGGLLTERGDVVGLSRSIVALLRMARPAGNDSGSGGEEYRPERVAAATVRAYRAVIESP